MSHRIRPAFTLVLCTTLVAACGGGGGGGGVTTPKLQTGFYVDESNNAFTLRVVVDALGQLFILSNDGETLLTAPAAALKGQPLTGTQLDMIYPGSTYFLGTSDPTVTASWQAMLSSAGDLSAQVTRGSAAETITAAKLFGNAPLSGRCFDLPLNQEVATCFTETTMTLSIGQCDYSGPYRVVEARESFIGTLTLSTTNASCSSLPEISILSYSGNEILVSAQNNGTVFLAKMEDTSLTQ